MRRFLQRLAKILSYIFTLRFWKADKYFKDAIYKFSIIRKFYFCGENANIEKPVTLIGGEYISIGNNFVSFARLRIEAFDEFNGNKYSPQIKIGNNVNINYDCHIGCINEIKIGNNVLIGSRVLITDHSHGNSSVNDIELPPIKRNLFSKGKVKIEDNVWIGDAVIILPGVTIGRNSIIGANAVITKDVKPYSVVVGNPGKVIKTVVREV